MEENGDYTVICPHCGKEFTAALLAGPSGGPGGFKCPHCRLFVPFERVDEQLVQPTD